MRAFTLIETLVTMFVMLMVSLALGWLLMLGKTNWQAGVDRSCCRQSLETAAEKIATDLRNSTPGSLVVQSGTLSFITAENDEGVFQTNAAGDPDWRRAVVYYVDGDANLRLREVPRSTPQPLTTAELAALKSGAGRILLNHVQAFSPSRPVPANVRVVLTTHMLDHNGKIDNLSYDFTTILRN